MMEAGILASRALFNQIGRSANNFSSWDSVSASGGGTEAGGPPGISEQ